MARKLHWRRWGGVGGGKGINASAIIIKICCYELLLFLLVLVFWYCATLVVVTAAGTIFRCLLPSSKLSIDFVNVDVDFHFPHHLPFLLHELYFLYQIHIYFLFSICFCKHIHRISLSVGKLWKYKCLVLSLIRPDEHTFDFV